MNEQADDDCDHVHSQLFGRLHQISNAHDPSRYKAHYPERRVPNTCSKQQNWLVSVDSLHVHELSVSYLLLFIHYRDLTF